MMKVFHWFQPLMIARYVKAFHQGSFFIKEKGPFRFENGLVCYDATYSPDNLRSIAEINRELKQLRQCQP